nr:NAD-dependent epimerase/dehydratase family protein [Bacteroidota bacterium]
MILVTGSTGFLGAHLLYELICKGLRVKALYRKGSDIDFVRKTFSRYCTDFTKKFEPIQWIEGDIMDLYSLQEALEGIDKVYHTAGKVSYNATDKDVLLRVNQLGTQNLVNACLDAKVKKLCHVSSVSALGRSEQGETITELHLWKTSRINSYYAISKYGAEREVWRGVAEGLDAVIVNPSVIIGPGNWKSGSAKMFSTIYKWMPFYTPGTNGYVDVRDVAAIMVKLMESDIKNERFIVSSEDIPYRQLIWMIAQNLERGKPFIRLPKILAEIGWRLEYLKRIVGIDPTFTREIVRSAFNKFYYDNQKAVKALDFEYTPIEESIKNTARIFLDDRKG